MTEETRSKANYLAEQIEGVKASLTNCSIMLEHHHQGLFLKSTSMLFQIPNDIADIVLQISKDALKKQLDNLEKEYANL